MRVPDTPVLGYALMGLLHQKARSGYELRKVFATTPIGTFSDSPGSIYPALARLEKRRWIRAAGETGDNPRQRKRFSLALAGLREYRRKFMSSVEFSSAQLAFECGMAGVAVSLRGIRRAIQQIERNQS